MCLMYLIKFYCHFFAAKVRFPKFFSKTLFNYSNFKSCVMQQVANCAIIYLLSELKRIISTSQYV